MKNVYIFLVLLLLCFHQISARTLHLILVVNVEEKGREQDRKADFNDIKQTFTEIAGHLGANFNLIYCSGLNFSKTQVIAKCNALKCTADDMVVFYFSGHGGNEKTEKWPVIGLNNDELLQTTEIIKPLKAYNTKFLMVIMDCCNNYINGIAPPKQNNPINPEKYKKLFYDFKGKRQVIVSASIPGQASYSDKVKGSYFKQALLEALHRSTGNDVTEVNWDMVLMQAKKLTQASTQNTQIPQFNVITQTDAFEEQN